MRPTIARDGFVILAPSPWTGRLVPVWWSDDHDGAIVSLSGPVSLHAPLVVRGRTPDAQVAEYLLRRDGHKQVTVELIEEPPI